MKLSHARVTPLVAMQLRQSQVHQDVVIQIVLTPKPARNTNQLDVVFGVALVAIRHVYTTSSPVAVPIPPPHPLPPHLKLVLQTLSAVILAYARLSVVYLMVQEKWQPA